MIKELLPASPCSGLKLPHQRASFAICGRDGWKNRKYWGWNWQGYGFQQAIRLACVVESYMFNLRVTTRLFTAFIMLTLA